jgi:hypothetical protein
MQKVPPLLPNKITIVVSKQNVIGSLHHFKDKCCPVIKKNTRLSTWSLIIYQLFYWFIDNWVDNLHPFLVEGSVLFCFFEVLKNRWVLVLQIFQNQRNTQFHFVEEF